MGKYDDKRNDSFKTRYKLFLFEMAFKGMTPMKLIAKNTIKDIIKEFEEFKIDKNLIDAYAANYYQKNYNEEVQYKKFDSLKVDEIWNSMSFEKNNLFQLTDYRHRKNVSDKYLIFYDGLKKSYEEIFEKLFPKNVFKQMINEKNCQYCGISEDTIATLGKNGKLYNKRSETRGYSLEIDRKEANQEYTQENCCMSCYWCNNAKTDEFNVKQFKEIARGINNVWNERLDRKEKIEFPQNTIYENI